MEQKLHEENGHVLDLFLFILCELILNYGLFEHIQ